MYSPTSAAVGTYDDILYLLYVAWNIYWKRTGTTGDVGVSLKMSRDHRAWMIMISL